MSARHYLIIPAAGIGTRMGAELPKQYLSLAGKPLLQHTLERLHGMHDFQAVVLAVAPGDPWLAALQEKLPRALRDKLITVEGGSSRAESVRNALQALAGAATDQDWMLVHDAVRPCLRSADLHKLLNMLQDVPGGGLLAIPVRDTLKLATAEGQVARTVDRQQLWQAQTPQMFRYALLQQALQKALSGTEPPTDEAAAVEALGTAITLVEGHPDNLKLTYPGDLALIEALLGSGVLDQAGQAAQEH